MKFARPMFAPHTSLIERIWYFALRGLAVLTLLYLVLPVLVIVPLSFSSSTFLAYLIPSYSLRWYQNLVSSEEWRMAAKNSFIVAPAATLVATVFGTLAAIGLNKAEFRGKALLMAILVSPMIVPVPPSRERMMAPVPPTVAETRVSGAVEAKRAELTMSVVAASTAAT